MSLVEQFSFRDEKFMSSADKDLTLNAWITFLRHGCRPNTSAAKTVMHVAPYWNCSAAGDVCTGSMKIPQQKSVAAIDAWEDAFFDSEFTHANGASSKHPDGLLALWKCLCGKSAFPVRYLLPAKETLSDFVNPHEHRE